MHSALADVLAQRCNCNLIHRIYTRPLDRLQGVRRAHFLKISSDGGASLQLRASTGTVQSALVASLPRLLDDVVNENTALLQDISSHTNSVLLGIDPDNQGAVAVVRFQQPGLKPPIHTALQAVDVEVHDMPCIGVSVGKRTRRQADADAVCTLVQRIITESPQGSVLYAVLEEPTPGPLNGRQAVFASAFSYGLWGGILRAHGVTMGTISARRWKQDMGLTKQGKEGSRALANALFPTAEAYLRRKKDHGRAEAMLLLAWGLGVRIPKTTLTAKQLADAEPLGPADPELASSDVEEEAEEIANLSSVSMRVLADEYDGERRTSGDAKEDLVLLRARA